MRIHHVAGLECAAIGVWLICLLNVASAADYHVTPSGSGSADGSNWSNAYAGLPGRLERGSTYYLAPGTYNPYTVDDPPSGTQLIIIKKATPESHGSGTGWQSSYGTGQAVFRESIILNNTAYVTIDGGYEYGIKVLHPTEGGHAILVGPWGGAASFDRAGLTLRYLELSGPAGSAPYPWNHQQIETSGINIFPYISGNSFASTPGMLISHCDIHGFDTMIHTTEAPNLTIEYCKLHDNLVTDSYNPVTDPHGNVVFNSRSDNTVFRYNEVYNWAAEGFYPVDSTNQIIYGNIFHDPQPGQAAEAINPTGWGGSIAPITLFVYNNVFANMPTHITLRTTYSTAESQSASAVYNNIFYNSNFPGYGATPHNYNWYSGSSTNGEPNGVAGGGSNPFVNLSARDYHLAAGSSAIDKGRAITTPAGQAYNQTRDGVTRPQGAAWDIGAYEYSVSTAPRAPSDLQVTAQ